MIGQPTTNPRNREPKNPMTIDRASIPRYDATNDNRFGPSMIEHRTAGAGLSQLGTYFMVYDTDGHSDPWTIQYEETIYVIEGQARLIVVESGTDREVTGEPGDLIVLTRGTTVRYGAAVGTRLLLSISPVNWRERQ